MSVPAPLMGNISAGPGSAGNGAPGGLPPTIQIGGGPAAGGPSDGPDSPDSEQDLHDALDALHKFMQDETDHVDKTTVAKCISAIQGLLGTRQKGAESALGVTPAHKAMSRAY